MYRYRKSKRALVRRRVITALPGSVDWFVCLYEHHSVSVAQKNFGFFLKLEMCII